MTNPRVACPKTFVHGQFRPTDRPKQRLLKRFRWRTDPFVSLNTQLSQSLTRLGIQHHFETYDGDHGSHIKPHFAEKLIPFFTANLSPAK